MSKISLNPKYTNTSGASWSTTTYNGLEYHISTNKNNSSVSTLKCEFTTPYDNIDVVIEIGSSSENNYDWCYIGKLDDSSPSYDSNYLDRISGIINNGPKFKTVTINVAKAGTHFLIIGYRKDGSGNVGNDCGYFRLVTTEVDSLKPDKYIYCGTKKKLEPIEFSKDNNSSNGFAEYSGSDERLQWGNRYAGNNSNRRSRISFMTTSDNITVTLIYERYFNSNGDKFVASSIDGSLTFTENDYVYIAGAGQGVVTKEITVSKAGKHYIDIGYVLINSRSYIHVGFSGSNIILNVATPESILVNNRNIDEVYVGSNLIWGRKKYLPKFSIYLQGAGIGNTQYTFKYDNSHVFNSTKIDDDNIVINYDTDSLTQSKDNNFNNAITPTGWNNNSVTFKLVNTTAIDDTINKGVEIFKDLKVKKLDLTELDLTNSPNFNSFNNIFINLGAYNNPVNVVTGPNFDTQYITTFEGAFAIPKSKVVFDFSKSPKFKISSSANIKNIFYGSTAGDLNWCEFILNKNIDDYTKSIFTKAVNSNKIKVSYI